MKKLIIASVSFLLFLACDDEVQQGPNFTDGNLNDVEIRISNKSNFTLDSIYLNTSGGEKLYNSVSKNKISDYASFSKAYPIFHLRFYAAGKKFENIPLDYTGESKVDFGRYSLEISVVDTLNKSYSYLLKAD